MKIEGKKVRVPADKETVFNYIADLNNFKNLLPQDRITDFESTTDYCSFKIQGTATIDLHLKDTEKFNNLLLSSGEKSPFPFTLQIFLNQKSDEFTQAYQIMEANVNPFLKMMVEKPLANLFDYIAERLTVEVNKQS
jgi:carbon monoxide dehydrogenase subunit G